MLLRHLHRRTNGRTGGSECHSGIHGTTAPDAAPAVKTAMYTAAIGEKRQAAFLFASMTEKPLVSGKTAESTFGIKSWIKIAAMVCPDNPFLRNSVCIRLTAVHRPSA